MPRPSVVAPFALLAILAIPAARPASAQGSAPRGHVHGGHATTAGASGDSATLVAATERAMGGHATRSGTRGHHDALAMAHLRMTPARVARAPDSARAADVVRALREATTKYHDVRRGGRAVAAVAVRVDGARQRVGGRPAGGVRGALRPVARGGVGST